MIVDKLVWTGYGYVDYHSSINLTIPSYVNYIVIKGLSALLMTLKLSKAVQQRSFIQAVVLQLVLLYLIIQIILLKYLLAAHIVVGSHCGLKDTSIFKLRRNYVSRNIKTVSS